MAMKRMSGGKKPMARTASKAKTRTVVVDPSSSIPKMREAQARASARYKAINNSIDDSDYTLSRAADTYAKELKKIGIPVDVTKWMDYVPVVSTNSTTVANKPKGSLKKTSSRGMPKTTNLMDTKSSKNRSAVKKTANKSYNKVEAKRLKPKGR
jgi:hypothetical protein